MSYFTDFRNWFIPSTLGPYSLVAPFWDDLYQVSSPAKKVYAYSDTANHRYIVEWNVMNYAPGNPPEIFEVLLLDPDYYPMETGDGMIVFQYYDIVNLLSQPSDNHYATVGIKSPDALTGLQWTYWNHYSEGAALLSDGRAIKFTTQIPEVYIPPIISDLIITISENDVILSWSEIEEASVYHIYRAIEPYFDISVMTPIANPTNAGFTDIEALNSGHYFYRVTWE
jgi:hypothetical protein